MSDHVTLEADKREDAGTQVAKKLRRQGIVPAVVYGGKQDCYPIQVNAIRFRDILKSSASEQILVNLQIAGAKEKDKLALIQQVQHHPLTGDVLHIDFNAVQEDVHIHASVPIELTGEPVGVKHGGILDHQLHQVEVSCLPADLPSMLSFDVSNLDINDALHVGEVSFPEGVEPGADGGVVIAIVSESSAAKSEGEEEEAAAEAEAAADAEGAEEGGGEGDEAASE